MQFHLNGFRPGDPHVAEAAAAEADGNRLPHEVDVLIVGCGPAGLTIAAQLAAFPQITTCIVEQKSGPLQLGQADGIACRTMEMFEAFGFSERVLKEAYWVNETAFWKPGDAPPHPIVRDRVIQDTEDGLSEFPHVILNQARVHDFFLDSMRNSPSRLTPAYGWRLTNLNIEPETDEPHDDHPVRATLTRLADAHSGDTETVRARYVVGCDGARSMVRQALGLGLHGDSANQAWGVMDVLAVTDFPDIRRKAIVHSATEGNLLVIPREGGYLVRLYIELDELNENERVASRNITVEHLIAAARRIFKPYSIDVKEVAWWSVYEIGQRLCDKFDDVPVGQESSRQPRGFIAGDACHTHSPKAGQGMNVSMRDAFNLGWKLAAVLLGRSSPLLLHTYSTERHAIAKELIDFDREFAKLFSARASTAADDGTDTVDPTVFQSYFIRHGRFTAGTAMQYQPSLITGVPAWQHLARGLEVGTRFHSAPVVRFSDTKPVELGHCVKADGRWRLFVFADRERAAARALCNRLAESPESPVRRYTPRGEDIDSVIDVRCVFQQTVTDIDADTLPTLLVPIKGVHGLRDYEKVFCPDLKAGQDVFSLRGIDREAGCMVLVRPDQHVAHVLPLRACDELAAFFDAFMQTPAQGGS